MIDFSKPTRMSLSALFIIFTKNFKSLFGAFVVLFLIKMFDSDISLAKRALVTLSSFGALTAVAFVTALIAYMPKKFYVSDGNLIFSHGLFHRETSTIPLDRVHTLRTRRGLWYRLFEMRGITFDTIASRGEEIELILDETEWQQLLQVIEKEEKHEVNAPVSESFTSAHSIQFDNSSLIADALCQNHLKGFAILLGFLATIYDSVNDFLDNSAVYDMAVDTADKAEGFLSSIWLLAGAAVILYIVVLALWIGKIFMRYANMTLDCDRRLLTFNYGLVQRSSSRFAFDKVCSLWVKRNFLEKKWGLATIMLKQAFNATSLKDDDNFRMYGRDNSDFLLKWWLGDNYADDKVLIASASGRGVFWASFLFPLVLCIIAAVILYCTGEYGWLIVPAIFLIFFMLRAYMARRRSKIVLKESYIEIYGGYFAENISYVKYEDVEVVRKTRTPLARWSHRASIALATSGTGFNVRSLREKDVEKIYEMLLLNKF